MGWGLVIALLAPSAFVLTAVAILCARVALTPSNNNPTRNTPDEIREQAGRGFHGAVNSRGEERNNG